MSAQFPFTAVAGQARFKLGLMLCAVNPAIGGLLVAGPRGSAKSTLARGLADILPAGINTHAFVTLPLGCSEEMLCGSLDLQQVLVDKKLAFRPGLLAKADNGVLYVDEVNLLADNLVDLLLDVAASGVNMLERDGLSHSHSAQFILLGTMNPDEGELRPQLQDRFGLSVELDNAYSIEQRVEIVTLREDFDRDSAAFTSRYCDQQQALRVSIEQARTLLATVDCKPELRVMIAQRCDAAAVDGLRADIVWFRAACAHAALNGRAVVREHDILAVEELVLCHRRQQVDQQQPQTPQQPPPFQRPPSAGEPAGGGANPGDNAADSDAANAGDGAEGCDWGSMAPEKQGSVEQAPLVIKQPSLAVVEGCDRSHGFDSRRVDWFRTLLCAATDWPLKHIQFQRRHARAPRLHLLLLDTSASTLEAGRFAAAKGAVLQIADRAYLAREQLAILGFKNDGSISTLLTRRRAPKALHRLLDDISACGGTPLSQMIAQAARYQRQLLRQNPRLQIHSYIISDGRCRQDFKGLSLQGQVTVIDSEQAAIKRGRARALADALAAQYLPLMPQPA